MMKEHAEAGSVDLREINIDTLASTLARRGRQ